MGGLGMEKEKSTGRGGGGGLGGLGGGFKIGKKQRLSKLGRRKFWRGGKKEGWGFFRGRPVGVWGGQIRVQRRKKEFKFPGWGKAAFK